MDENNVCSFPVNSYQRWKNRLGPHAVPCLVSERWLQFPTNSDVLNNEHYMFVDVMTMPDGQNPRKLTSVCLSKEEIIKVLETVK